MVGCSWVAGPPNYIFKEDPMKKGCLLVVLVMILMLAGTTALIAGGQGRGAEKIRIMFVNPWPSLPFWAVGSEGAHDAAKKLEPLGVDFTETGTDEGYSNASLVLSIIETAIAQQYDVIICHPFIPETFEATINKAVDAGIYVIAVADDAPRSKRSGALSTDDINAGRGGGQALVEALGSTKGKVAILSSTPGVLQLENRMKGFKQVVEEAGHEVVSVEFGFSDVTQNLSKVQAQLTAHPEINAFFGAGGDHAPSIVQVLGENNKLDDVVVVGFDDDPNTIQGVKDGHVYATVVQRQYLWGYGGVVYGYLLAKGEKIPAFTDTGFLLVNKDNVDNFAQLTHDTSQFDALLEKYME
jgi:ribose transport system substrate-binding protein